MTCQVVKSIAWVLPLVPYFLFLYLSSLPLAFIFCFSKLLGLLKFKQLLSPYNDGLSLGSFVNKAVDVY